MCVCVTWTHIRRHRNTVKPTILLHPYYKCVHLHKTCKLISFPVLSSLFSSSFLPHSFLFCYFFSILLPDAPFTHHCSFSNPAGDPRLLLQDKPHHKDSTGAPHTLIISFPQPPTPLLACPGLSLVQPQPSPMTPPSPYPLFPTRWRCPYIYVQYGTCLVVYVYVRLLLARGPGLL